MPKNTKINKPVNCKGCGAVLFTFNEEDLKNSAFEEVNMTMRCGKCKLEQSVKLKKNLDIKID